MLLLCERSIVGVKRVGATLETLGLPTRMLHADMSQVRVAFIGTETFELAVTKTYTIFSRG